MYTSFCAHQPPLLLSLQVELLVVITILNHTSLGVETLVCSSEELQFQLGSPPNFIRNVDIGVGCFSFPTEPATVLWQGVTTFKGSGSETVLDLAFLTNHVLLAQNAAVRIDGLQVRCECTVLCMQAVQVWCVRSTVHASSAVLCSTRQHNTI